MSSKCILTIVALRPFMGYGHTLKPGRCTLVLLVRGVKTGIKTSCMLLYVAVCCCKLLYAAVCCCMLPTVQVSNIPSQTFFSWSSSGRHVPSLNPNRYPSGLLRGADKSLARPRWKQANVSVRIAWISFGALPCRKKKTWWQLASRCCWNRARPWHASELVSFLVGLRTYQHPVVTIQLTSPLRCMI